MGKIDLIDNGWVDLVFEGKNQAYGAYQLRKNTGIRNLKALAVMFAAFLIIAGIVYAKVSIENYIASKNAAIEADVELQSLAEKKEIKSGCFPVFYVLDHHFLSLLFGEIMTDMNSGLIGRKQSIFNVFDDKSNRQQAFAGCRKWH